MKRTTFRNTLRNMRSIVVTLETFQDPISPPSKDVARKNVKVLMFVTLEMSQDPMSPLKDVAKANMPCIVERGCLIEHESHVRDG
jgi:hypothetical protein